MNAHVRLTPFRAAILRLAEVEGAISISDVVDDQPRRGSGIRRAAAKQLKALADLGLLTPIRICEYTLSSVGRQWLDNHRSPP